MVWEQARMTPRQWLETAVDAERAEELIKHRQRLRKPLTDYAAKLLAGKLAKCPDPNAAADMCIEKGWQSIEPGWVTSSMQRATGRPMTNLDRLEMDLAERIQNGTGGQGSLDFASVPRLSGRG